MTDPLTLFAALALVAAAPEAPAATMPATADRCPSEAPAQAGPRGPVRPPAGRCAAPSRAACGRYESHWPHWLAQRALPPVRQWVVERC